LNGRKGISIQEALKEILPLARMNLEDVRLKFKEKHIPSGDLALRDVLGPLEYDRSQNTLWYLPSSIINHDLIAIKGAIMREAFKKRYTKENLPSDNAKPEFKVLFNTLDTLRAISLGVAEFTEAGKWIRKLYDETLINLENGRAKMSEKSPFAQYIFGLLYRYTLGKDNARIKDKKIKELIELTVEKIPVAGLRNMRRRKLYAILQEKIWPSLDEIAKDSIEVTNSKETLKINPPKRPEPEVSPMSGTTAEGCENPGKEFKDLDHRKRDSEEQLQNEDRKPENKERASQLLMEGEYLESGNQNSKDSHQSVKDSGIGGQERSPESSRELGDGWGRGKGGEIREDIIHGTTGLGMGIEREYNQLRNISAEKALKTNLRRLLEDLANDQRKWDRGLSKGKLDLRKAAEAFAGDTKIFKKRLAKSEPKHIRFCVIIDVSGSMLSGAVFDRANRVWRLSPEHTEPTENRKFSSALSALIGLMEALSGVTHELKDTTNIEMEIVTFSSDWEIIVDYDEHNSPLNSSRWRHHVIKKIKSSSVVGGATENIPPIKKAAERIEQRAEFGDTNIMIIITDGISSPIIDIYKKHKEILFFPLGIGKNMKKIEETYAPYGKAVELEDLAKVVLNIGRSQLGKIGR